MSNVYSVGQINAYIKRMFAQDFVLNRVYVKGEISNCKYHTSGHIYFSLKDETGAISCILFAGSRKSLAFHLENGQKVVAYGAVSVYERDGTYQLYVREVRLDGLGELYERFEARKRELEEMGMFAQEYKQSIPKFIHTLGVVTAPTGAAVRDIIHVAKRRNPGVKILLYPAKVQGDGAAESVARGIRTLDDAGVDVMIVGRGGGSIEDLWAFNEETVARAVFECRTPVISAVGHETDVTICDYVADLRAPTPSAGAELAVFDVTQAVQRLEQYEAQLCGLFNQHLDETKSRLEQVRLQLRMNSPEHRIREMGRRLAEKEDKLRYFMSAKQDFAKNRLLIYIERLKGLSPLHKLEQGYAFLTNESGRRITSASQVERGKELYLYLLDGQIKAHVEQVVQKQAVTGKLQP